MSEQASTQPSGQASAKDTFAGACFVIGILLALGGLGFRPFLLDPIGLIVILIGAGTSAKHRRLGMGAAFVIAGCFVLGAAIAVWKSRALF